MKAKNLTGTTFGTLTALERVGSDERGKALWRCACTCGNAHVARADNLLAGNTRACKECVSPHMRTRIENGSTNAKQPYSVEFYCQTDGTPTRHRGQNAHYSTMCIKEADTGKIIWVGRPIARRISIAVPRAMTALLEEGRIGERGRRRDTTWAEGERVKLTVLEYIDVYEGIDNKHIELVGQWDGAPPDALTVEEEAPWSPALDPVLSSPDGMLHVEGNPIPLPMTEDQYVRWLQHGPHTQVKPRTGGSDGKA